MTVEISTDYRVEAGESLTFTELPYLLVGSGSLTIAGRVVVIGAGPYSIAGVASDPNSGFDGLFHVVRGGSITVKSNVPGVQVFLFSSATWGADVRNDGQMIVQAAGNAKAIWSYDPYFHLDNTGRITVTTSSGAAVGVDMHNGGAVNNTGFITVTGESLAYGVYYYGGGGPSHGFFNSGTIRAIATGPTAVSVGVYATSLSTRETLYVNTGTIEGDYAFYADSYGYSSPVHTPEVLQNSGKLLGAVEMGLGDDKVLNTGEISGPVFLNDGQDIFDGRGGSSVEVYGDNGSDNLFGGSNADYLSGGAGSDVIQGGGGDDFIDGGRASNLLDGGAGIDTVSYLSSTIRVVADLQTETAFATGIDRIRGFERVIGSAYDDVISGYGAAETLEGNAGDDTLSGRGGDDILFGDRGSDTLTGGEGRDQFLFTAGDGTDVITDFKVGTDILAIFGFAGVQQIRQIGADTLIVLSATDSVLLKNVQAEALTTADVIIHNAPLEAAPDPVLVTPMQWLTEDTWIGLGEIITIDDDDGFFLDYDGSPWLVNGGLIDVGHANSSYSVTGFRDEGSRQGTGVYNLSTGVIEVHGDGSGASLQSGGLDFYNDGFVRVTGSNARGFYSDGVVVNTGVIRIDGMASAYGGLVDQFWNSGEFVVERKDSGASYGSASGLEMRQNTIVFVNSGTFRVIDQGPNDSVALHYASGLQVHLYNSGLIEADVAVRELWWFSSPDQRTDRFWNSGELRGRVEFLWGRDELVNSGKIVGPVTLGTENDLYDGRMGTQVGGVWGEGGADTLLAGVGDDRLDGGAGDDLLFGGAGADTLTGGDGNDTFRFEAGSGADIITDFTAGGAIDAIAVAGYSAYQSLIQQGNDTLVVFSATDSILLKNVQASTLTSADFRFGASPLGATPTAPPPPAPPTASPSIARSQISRRLSARPPTRPSMARKATISSWVEAAATSSSAARATTACISPAPTAALLSIGRAMATIRYSEFSDRYSWTDTPPTRSVPPGTRF